MVATINIQPNLTTNAAGSFPNPSTVGVIQGTAYGDPAVRYQLAGGILASTETLPMWGGVGISENVPTIGTPSSLSPSTTLGGKIIRATNYTSSSTAAALTGFSVFDQNWSAIVTPTSEVPLIGSGGQVNFYRLGTNARIAVACDPALVDLYGDIITTTVSWDFNNQLLVPYTASLTFSSGTYNNTTGVVSITFTTAEGLSPGDSIVVSSLTGSNITSQNGTYTLLTVSSDTITYQAAAGAGATTITGGTFVPGSGSDVAIPVKVLEIIPSNNMTVQYNSTTGNASWNRNGACAIILI